MPLTRDQQERIVRAIYAIPGFQGVPIGMYTGDRSVTLARGTDGPRSSGVYAVIIEESAVSAALDGAAGSRGFKTASSSIGAGSCRSAASAPQASMGAGEVREGAAAAATLRTNGSRMSPELWGAGLSCTFAVVALIGVSGSVAAAPATAGASLAVTAVAWTGVVTGAAQCLNGLYRAHEVWFNPDGTSLQELDDESWYTSTSLIVDAVGLGTGLPAIRGAGRAILTRLEVKGLLNIAALRTMNGEGRRKTIAAAIERAKESNPDLLNPLLQASVDARRVAAEGGRLATTASRRGASAAARAIDARLVAHVNQEVRKAIVPSLQVGVSALPEEWVGSASGSVNWAGKIIIHLIAPD